MVTFCHRPTLVYQGKVKHKFQEIKIMFPRQLGYLLPKLVVMETTATASRVYSLAADCHSCFGWQIRMICELYSSFRYTCMCHRSSLRFIHNSSKYFCCFWSTAVFYFALGLLIFLFRIFE